MHLLPPRLSRTVGAVVLFIVLSAVAPAQRAIFQHGDGTTHWYDVVAVPAGITWADAHLAAARRGGYLATIESKAENDVVFQLVDRSDLWRQSTRGNEWLGPWFGGVQKPSSTEPAGGWSWVQLEAFAYDNWHPGQPDNVGAADRMHFGGNAPRVATWVDSPRSRMLRGYVIEFSGPTSPITVGQLVSTKDATPGYTLHNPLASGLTYLIDRRGRVVNSWQSQYRPGVAAYLLPNGNLLREGNTRNPNFRAGGTGGIIEEFNWQGQRVWNYTYSNSQVCAHHDFVKLPNGNVLILAWEFIDGASARAAGRDPAKMNQNSLWPEKIIEVKPDPSGTGGTIVWEWRSWDHIIQDFDATKPNYGDVSQHPELIDLNYSLDDTADWMHANSLDYNAELDQIVISARTFDEIWIIDHSTTTREAAGHTGGRSGMGGDLLYRWGNPMTYRAGTVADRKLLRQHDAHWIPKGLPGAGNLLIFNNGDNPAGLNHSSVDEIVLPPRNPGGSYIRQGRAFGPANPVWQFEATPKEAFYSAFVSGMQRLPNGNTMICGGTLGVSFEVRPNGEYVWVYRNPITATGPLAQGAVPSQTLGPTGTPVFRSPFYAPDYPAFRGRTLTPGGPVERHDHALLVNGSTKPAYAKLGTTVDFSLRAKGHEGSIYIVGSAITEGLYPMDTRFVALGLDPILVLSCRGGAPGTFRNYIGRIGNDGTARAGLTLPNIRHLIGLEFYTAFVVDDQSKPSQIGFVSNTVTVEVIE